MKLLRDEPVAFINGVVAVVEALILLAVAFGLELSGEQVALVMAVVIAISNLFKTVFARSRVSPVTASGKVEGSELMAETYGG